MPKSFKNVLETSLKTSKPILAFNIQNMQQLKALAVASKKNNKNVIAQFSEKYFELFSKNFDFIKIKKHYKNYNVHFFLDHCTDKKKIIKAVNLKFDGVMYDGSNLDVLKNIKTTNQIYQILKNKKTVLEAEIGIIPGQKDYGIKSKRLSLNFKDLEKFIKKAKFHILAIAAGNTHGLKNNKINLNLYKFAISKNPKIKIVFHGASGIKFEYMKKIFKFNLVKVNYSSILKKEMNSLMNKFQKKNISFDQINYDKFLEYNLAKFFSKIIKKYK
mgnify:CR=1 FL=1